VISPSDPGRALTRFRDGGRCHTEERCRCQRVSADVGGVHVFELGKQQPTATTVSAGVSPFSATAITPIDRDAARRT
jgi:hypothetical protein